MACLDREEGACKEKVKGQVDLEREIGKRRGPMAGSPLQSSESGGSREPWLELWGQRREVWRCTQVAMPDAVWSRRRKIGDAVRGHGWSCVDRRGNT